MNRPEIKSSELNLQTCKRILVIQTAFLGDAVLATALLEKLYRLVPTAQIDFMVRKGHESLTLNHPYIHKTLVWDKSSNKFKYVLSLLKQIRETKYDLVINLQRFASTGFLTALSKAKFTIGFSQNPWSFAFSHKVHFVYGAKGKPGPHEVERVQSTISAFADNFKDPPKLYPTAQDFAAIAAWDRNPFITISPATVWPTKMTPMNVWVEASNQFSSDVTFVILGGPSDLNLCESLKNLLSTKHNSNKIVNLAGKVTLLQSAALMSKAIRNFTNDSAPLHIASAMQAPVTASFCSTIPEFGFGPFHDNGNVIQTAEDLSCRPCGLHGHKVCPMRHFRCGNIQIRS